MKTSNFFAYFLLSGEDQTNNVLKVESNRSSYLNGTTSQVVKSGAGRFFGFIVNSNTAGSLKFWDNTAGSGTVIINTFTPTTATSGVFTFPEAVEFSTGLFVTVGGTIDYTILYK